MHVWNWIPLSISRVFLNVFFLFFFGFWHVEENLMTAQRVIFVLLFDGSFKRWLLIWSQ